MSINVIIPQAPSNWELVDNIPTALRVANRWILWRYELQGNRWAKVPCDSGGRHINHLDSKNFLTFEQALAAYREGKSSGVGFVLGDGFAGIDLDSCIVDDGTLRWWARGLMGFLPPTYAEVSPSGRGLKLFFRSQAAVGRRKGSVELYSQGRFFTVTGQHFAGTPRELAEVPQETIATLAERLDLVDLAARLEKGEFGPELQRLFTGDWTGYPSQSEADLAFISLLIHRVGLDDPEALDFLMRLSALYRPKWDERHSSDGQTYGAMTIERALGSSEGVLLPAETTSSGAEFPENCLLGLAGDFARLFANYYEAPVEFWFCSFLTVLGHLLGDSVTIASDLQPQPRLYTVLLGRSGVEKKSTAIRRTVRFFEEAGFSPKALYGVGSAEGLAEAMRDTLDLLLVADEFRALVSKTRIEGSVLGPMLASLFELNSWDHRTKGKHLKIRGARLSLLAASTAESYALVWDAHNLAIGLPNRLLIVPGEAKGLHPFVAEVPPEELWKLQRQLEALFEEVNRRARCTIRVNGRETTCPDAVRLRLTPEAERLWAEWYADRPKDIHSVRLDTIGLRLAILLAVSCGNLEEIDETTVERVCQILGWQYRVRLLHDPIDAVNTVAEVEEKIRRVLRASGPLSWRDLQRKVHASRYGLWIFEQAVENLRRNREIAFFKQGRSKMIMLLRGE